MKTYDFADTPPQTRYKLLIATVVPRPIALVTTLDPLHRPNAAPYSFFNVLSHDPAVVALGIERRSDGRPKDTVANIDANGEFVVNLVDETMAPGMVVCAATSTWRWSGAGSIRPCLSRRASCAQRMAP